VRLHTTKTFNRWHSQQEKLIQGKKKMSFELSEVEQLEKRELQRKIDAFLAKPSLTQSEQKQCDLLLSQMANFRSKAERVAKLKQVAERAGEKIDLRAIENPTEERKASFELRKTLLHGEEHRTYAAMSLSGDSQLLPSQFEARLVQAMAVSGPFYAGSALLSNLEHPKNNTLHLPVADDTASTGYVLTENTQISEGEVTGYAAASFGTKTFSSGITLASLELVQDVSSWTTYEALLTKTIAARLSRIQNSMFVPQLMAALTANSSAAVAAAGSSLVADDIADLIGSVDAEYRNSDKAVFVMNASTQKALGLLKSTTGQRIFKKILSAKPELFDYPVVICKNIDSVASGNHPVLFGDFSTVFTRSIPGLDVSILREQFVLNGQVGLIVKKRADLQYSLPSTSDSAVKYIAMP
jgi:HK97 family phage major capsid protein